MEFFNLTTKLLKILGLKFLAGLSLCIFHKCYRD